MLSLGQPLAIAQQAQSPATTTAAPATEEAPKIPNDQLDSLVSPIALYPDPLLAQTLAASTYPLEIIQLQQWMEKNKNVKDKALADAVAKEPWDASVQAMAAFPDVVQRLASNVQWTTDLGNAFLEQQADVMDAVQRMRAKAQGTGNLKTSAQQKVETQTVEGGKQVIVVEQANPETVYVPSYDPAVVYGEPAYPYPSYSYPGYVPGMALSLGTGLALGAAWGGGWGYGCGWDGDDITINNNNNYVKNSNKNVNQNNKWGHNPEHRGGTPYANKQTASKYGGTARGEARQPTAGAGTRSAGGGAGKPGGPGGAGGAASAGKPGGPGGAGGAGGAGKPGGASGTGKASTGGAGKTTGGGAAKASGGAGKAGADKVGGHKPSAGGGGGGAFAGGSGGSAKAASSRGGSSMKGGGGGGGGRGGGGGGKKGGGGGGRGR